MYIFLVFIVHLIEHIKAKTWRDYYLYYKLSENTFTDFCCQIILNYKSHYIGAVFEEFVFRGPLIYIDNIYIYYLINILFALQHWNSTKSLRLNIDKIIVTFILGLVCSQIVYRYCLRYAILLHLLNNLLATLGYYVTDWKIQNSRRILNYLNEELESWQDV